MALSTVQTELINDASPINNDFSVGDRLRYLDTAGFYGTTGGGFVKVQITTIGTSNTTASVEADFHGPHGLVHNTGTGYYTLAQPVAGCHLLWWHGGCTDQYIRARQSGTGATGPSFSVGTGTTYMVIETTKQAGLSLDFYGLSSEMWLVASHTSDDALLGLATSS
jgi:hypothetical protein